MPSIHVVSYRGSLVESTHSVSAAVCDADGALHAWTGDPERYTVLRSAAKPFQALPLLLDGAAERYGVSDDELALACASHNSERSQVAIVERWLERIGLSEEDLACGPHPPLSRDLAVRAPDTPKPDPAPRSRSSSNCSGKHTGMLTLARFHDWPTAGYNRSDHAVQRRILEIVSEYVGLPPDHIGQAVDGCAAVTFAMPLAAMATGFARLVSWDEREPRRIVDAMTSHPQLVAGQGRLCTDLMRAFPGQLLAKVGAEGVYGAALTDAALGVALKVEDGNWRACNIALLAVLEQLGLDVSGAPKLDRYRVMPVLNTRGEEVGVMRAEGMLALTG